MYTFNEITIPTKSVESLCWRGEYLVDVLGCKRYGLDGSIIDDSPRRWYERLDSAVISPSGNYAVIFEKLGTKGEIIALDEKTDGTIDQRCLREINRSDDNAEAFEYPVLLFNMPDGRELIAHCPDEYDHLVIEDLSGEKRFTASPAGLSHMDYYYSRLAINPGGTRILSTGWAWHPYSMIVLYDVQKILDDPRELDKDDAVLNTPTEISSAAFIGNDMLVITGDLDSDCTENEPWLSPGGIAVYDLINRQCVANASLNTNFGTLMPVNSNLVVEFYKHPKLINIEKAEIVHVWEDIDSGEQECSIIWHIPPIPSIALDPLHQRFAVATDSSIRIVEISIT